MKKLFSALFIVSLVLGTLMAQPITEQQKIPLDQRIEQFGAYAKNDPKFDEILINMRRDALLRFQNSKGLFAEGSDSVAYLTNYQPLADLVVQTLKANSYDEEFGRANLYKIVADVEKRYYGIEFTSEIPGFDKIYKLISSNKDFDHIMEDEAIRDMTEVVSNPINNEFLSSSSMDFRNYARSLGFYFTSEEAKTIILNHYAQRLDEAIKEHSFEERAADFFRVMKERADYTEDLIKLNESMMQYLSSNMGEVITNMTNIEFYNTPILTAIDNILLSENLDVDNEDFGAYIADFYYASIDPNFVSDLPKFDELFEKISEYPLGDSVEISSKNLANYILHAPGNEERLAVFGANFAKYAESKGFRFTAEEGKMLIEQQLQYFVGN